MTVIAWDGKTLAADSMETDSAGYFIRNCKKLYRLKSGGMLGEAGMSDNRAIVALFDNVKDEGDLPTRAELEATKSEGSYIVVLPDKSVYHIEIDEVDNYARFVAQVMPSKVGPCAVGHGADYAIAAMALGKDAVGAVKLACKYSAYCRGPINTMRLEDKPKEKINRKRKPVIPEGAE